MAKTVKTNAKQVLAKILRLDLRDIKKLQVEKSQFGEMVNIVLEFSTSEEDLPFWGEFYIENLSDWLDDNTIRLSKPFDSIQKYQFNDGSLKVILK